jgi:UDP-2,4-diacetamido-2,4,6-trideoxy-beta-L-altropyranose hydrolase
MSILKKTAFFRFEASTTIGAGHAIRSCVIADALVNIGWECSCVTSAISYEFIPDLNRFKRIEPNFFELGELVCDLLVIDHYGLDIEYEKNIRKFSKKIWIVDDLANRAHDCDLLIDQTYGRNPDDYKKLVPDYCKVLAGSDYILLREDFIKLRPKALNKRKNTKKIERILICMGGSDPKNYTLKALELIKESNFKGTIDIVLGFTENNKSVIESYAKNLVNQSFFYTNAKMSDLILQADLAIGASGSGLWERYCLGLPSVLMITADNQKVIYNTLRESGKLCSLNEFLDGDFSEFGYEPIGNLVDGFGINRLIEQLDSDESDNHVTFRRVSHLDKDLIFSWQNIKETRKYFNNSNLPSYNEHEEWFFNRIKQYENPYWIICQEKQDVGCISLNYNSQNNVYDLSWYVIPEFCGKSIGTIAIKKAVKVLNPFKIYAFVKKENIASHKSLRKANFVKLDENRYISGEIVL